MEVPVHQVSPPGATFLWGEGRGREGRGEGGERGEGRGEKVEGEKEGEGEEEGVEHCMYKGLCAVDSG